MNPVQFVAVLGLCALACSREPSVGSSVSMPEDERQDPELLEEAGPPWVPGALQAIRLHYAHLVPPATDETLFLPLCPTGNDCHYSVSLFEDGRVVLDDRDGRVQGTLSATDLREVRRAFSAETEQLLQGPHLSDQGECPPIRSDPFVMIALTTRWFDGTEIMHIDGEGCLVGELSGIPDHPLTRLRQLVDGGLRWRYAGCDPPNQADARPEDDAARRPLCRVGPQAIEWDAKYEEVTQTATQAPP